MLCGLFTGCRQSTDLAAVRALATAAGASQTTFNALAADYYHSCQRRVVYETIGSAMEANFPAARRDAPVARPSPPRGEPAAALSDDEVRSLSTSALVMRMTVAAAAALTETQFILLRDRPDSAQVFGRLQPHVVDALFGKSATAPHNRAHACEKAQAAARAWEQANDVVIDYFTALGNLAGGTADDSYGVKALAQNIADAKALAPQRAAAIGSLANDVIDQIYAKRRRGELSAFIPQADASLQNAIATLESLAADDYVFSLENEHDAADTFFRRNLQLAQSGEQAFEVLGYADVWSQRMKALSDRRAGVRSYVTAWEALRGAHASLLQAIARNDSASALAVARAVYAQISPDIAALAKAFAVDE